MSDPEVNPGPNIAPELQAALVKAAATQKAAEDAALLAKSAAEQAAASATKAAEAKMTAVRATELSEHKKSERKTKQAAESDKGQSELRVRSYLSVLLGVVLIFTCLYIEAEYHTRPWYNSLVNVSVDFVQHLGLAFVLLALISIMLERKHWQEYFQQRLADVVVEDSYLNRLDYPKLQALQVKTWKALFKQHQIDREGGFLHYFEERLRGLIASPYREQADTIMDITEDPSNRDWLVYTTTISYRCRRVGGQLQPTVSCSPEEGEYKEITDVNVKLEIPIIKAINESVPHQPAIYFQDIEKPNISDDHLTYTFDFELLKTQYRDDHDPGTDTNQRISVPLRAFNNYDNFPSLFAEKVKYKRVAS